MPSAAARNAATTIGACPRGAAAERPVAEEAHQAVALGFGHVQRQPRRRVPRHVIPVTVQHRRRARSPGLDQPLQPLAVLLPRRMSGSGGFNPASAYRCRRSASSSAGTRATASSTCGDTLMSRPRSNHWCQDTPTPASTATSSCRSPAARRRDTTGRPACSGEIRARRLRRKSRNSDLPAPARTLDVTAFALPSGGFLLLFGRIADLFGRLRLFLAGLVLLTLASVFATVAWSAAPFLAARALQGLGAAAVMSTGMSQDPALDPRAGGPRIPSPQLSIRATSYSSVQWTSRAGLIA